MLCISKLCISDYFSLPWLTNLDLNTQLGPDGLNVYMFGKMIRQQIIIAIARFGAVQIAHL